MISTSEIALSYGDKKLFEDVSVSFSPGNCYGIIGANGAGKSTFLKILSGEILPQKGQVHIANGVRLSVLKQNHFHYNDCQVLETVLLGNERLVAISRERDALYAKADFSEADGIRSAHLESEFAHLGGWQAETEAATLLNGLGIKEAALSLHIRELSDADKVKVLLAQALFGNPDVLLLDEPTNHLDATAIRWLETYLGDFEKTVLIISHDRHFLNQVCTHMADIDYGKISFFAGNYDCWRQAIALARSLQSNENKKKEQRAGELEAFIQRFSANASKSKQATSRKKLLEKLTIDELPVSSRRNPHIVFSQKREAGDILLEVEGLSKELNGTLLFKNLSFYLKKGEKVIFVGPNEHASTALFDILSGKLPADSGSFRWGVTTTQAYLPKDHDDFFADRQVSLIDWLREYSEDKSELFIRGYLGRMLFSGDEPKKFALKLSGGEKVRCMLARMMLSGANVLLLDGPTNHLDLEAISALNDSLIGFPGTVLFSSHDHEFAETLATRLIELTPQGGIDHQKSFSEYLAEVTG